MALDLEEGEWCEEEDEAELTDTDLRNENPQLSVMPPIAVIEAGGDQQPHQDNYESISMDLGNGRETPMVRNSSNKNAAAIAPPVAEDDADILRKQLLSQVRDKKKQHAQAQTGEKGVDSKVRLVAAKCDPGVRIRLAELNEQLAEAQLKQSAISRRKRKLQASLENCEAEFVESQTQISSIISSIVALMELNVAPPSGTNQSNSEKATAKKEERQQLKANTSQSIAQRRDSTESLRREVEKSSQKGFTEKVKSVAVAVAPSPGEACIRAAGTSALSAEREKTAARRSETSATSSTKTRPTNDGVSRERAKSLAAAENEKRKGRGSSTAPIRAIDTSSSKVKSVAFSVPEKTAPSTTTAVQSKIAARPATPAKRLPTSSVANKAPLPKATMALKESSSANRLPSVAEVVPAERVQHESATAQKRAAEATEALVPPQPTKKRTNQRHSPRQFSKDLSALRWQAERREKDAELTAQWLSKEKELQRKWEAEQSRKQRQLPEAVAVSTEEGEQRSQENREPPAGGRTEASATTPPDPFLASIRAYRLSCLPPSALVGHPAVATRVDPLVPLCPFQLDGRCADTKCPWQHDNEYRLSEAQITADVLAMCPQMCPRGMTPEDYANRLLEDGPLETVIGFLLSTMPEEARQIRLDVSTLELGRRQPRKQMPLDQPVEYELFHQGRGGPNKARAQYGGRKGQQ